MSVKAAQSKGIVYITNLSNLRKVPSDNNYFFLTTRGKRTIDGVRYLSDLAPSQKLFIKYLNNWKERSDFNWWGEYRDQYISELNWKRIAEIKRGLDAGKNVTLICFCGNENYCHRSILRDIFKENGYEIISITKET